jgi:aldehyde:ferredoxin oxidoreductase
MNCRLLLIDPLSQHWRLETLRTETLDHAPREDYLILSGEALCQYLLRRDHEALVIARGPLPFISGNKASVGYVSPLTSAPHYSFVGGRAAAQILNLGLDGIVFESAGQHVSESQVSNPPIITVGGRAPNLTVEFKPAGDLPAGQRSAYYWLLERELNGDTHAGSIFTLGEGGRLGYLSANVAVEAIYHAGRGGAGAVFARYASAMVLRGRPIELAEFFGHADTPFTRNPNGTIAPWVDKYCARLSVKTGGTVPKLYHTGGNPEKKITLPANNARQVGYDLADLGSSQVLKATRRGQTGCHWCQVDCRHYHWVDVDYAPDGRDMFLDDFEPTYAIFAMLDLEPAEDTLQSRLELLAEVDRRLILPIEQMGCDIINIGLGLSALFEGIERGLIPASDAGISKDIDLLSPLDAAVQAVEMLHAGQTDGRPALRAVGDGPQALAQAYPAMQDLVFTSGKGSLGNAGHANALWTFLMPFSRFFGHYSGQIYKIDEALPPPGSSEGDYRACFRHVVKRMLQKEFFWVLCNALSMCAFTFVIFSQEGKGERLSNDDGRSSSASLIRLLRNYGIHTTHADLEWFAQAFWSQSIDLKCQFGWQPPAAEDFPRRVYEALALALERTPEELQSLMEMLIKEWKRQAGETMARFGYEVTWQLSLDKT